MACIWIDSDRKIIDTDDLWDQLALSYHADELVGQNIKGSFISKYIKGDQVRMFLDAMITRVNVTEKPYVLHYRCDGPGKAQFMRMMVQKENGNLFKIEHDKIKEKKISPKISFVEDEDAAEKRCSVCGRVKFKDNWYDALTHRKVFGTLTVLKTKSEVCPDCKPKLP